jgi:hypothetical protein
MILPGDAVALTKAQLRPTSTARNIVNYCETPVTKQSGIAQLGAGALTALMNFMKQDAASVDTVLDLDIDDWNNSTWQGYVSQRLQTLVASIAMLPDNMLR